MIIAGRVSNKMARDPAAREQMPQPKWAISHWSVCHFRRRIPELRACAEREPGHTRRCLCSRMLCCHNARAQKTSINSKVAIVKLLRFRTRVLCSIALFVMPLSRPATAQSYCPGCEAGIIGAAIGVGAAVGLGIY